MNTYKKIIAIMTCAVTAHECIASSTGAHTARLVCLILHSDSYRNILQSNYQKYSQITQPKLIKESQRIQQTIRNFNIQDFFKEKSYNISSKTINDSISKKLSPYQARQAIESNILALYKGESTLSPFEHLEQIQKHCQFLDPEKDKDAIKAINFMSENKNRSSYTDILFWRNAWYITGIIKALPIPKEIKEKHPTEIMIKIFELAAKSK